MPTVRKITISYASCADLNFLDIVAGPRKLEKPDDTLISPDLFESIKDQTLLCQICATVYDDPHNVRQCLHKFCQGCIEHYNRYM
jgi:hypothetical protein